MQNKIIDNRSNKAIIKVCKEIAEDTFEMTFELEKPLNYKSGQYLWVEIAELLQDDPKGNRRAFSITNPPENNGMHVSILFRKGESWFKKTLLQLPIGSSVNIIAPFGSSFLLPEKNNVPLILLSAGTGVSPFLCLMREVAEENISFKIYLLHYEDKKERIFLQQEIESFPQDKIQTKIFLKPFETNDLQKIPEIKNACFFISGPQAFIDHVHDLLILEGIKDSQLAYETFYPTPKNIRSLHALLETTIPANAEQKNLNSFIQNQIFRMALDFSSSHIVITDITGVIRYANKTAENITGYRISELIGQTPRIWGALMDSNYYKHLWSTKLQKLPFISEITNRRKNGELYTAILHMSPILDIDKSLIGFMATEEDITILRNREETLKTLTNRFQRTTSAANVATWEWDVITDKLISDDVLFRLYRTNLASDPRGAFEAWRSSLHPDNRERIANAVQEILQNRNKPFDLKYKIVTPTGEIKILRAIAEVVRDKNGKALKAYGVNWDITQEEELNRTKTEFISLASHELRTPMTTVRWYAEMLLHGDMGNLNAKQKDYIQTIADGNIHLVNIVNALLDVSRMELGTLATKMERTDLSKILEQMKTEFHPLMTKKELQYHASMDPSIPEVSMDPKFIEIILQNLLGNAVKYTPNKGAVTLSINLDTQKTHVIITVADTGCGIPLSDQAHIFSKLYRATNVRNEFSEGTGLGLYLTKSIVDSTGGIIWFKSEENKGSTFYVSYPVTGMKSI